MFIRALGFPSGTPIYIAAGEIYGGESRMADLQTRYPILMNKVWPVWIPMLLYEEQRSIISYNVHSIIVHCNSHLLMFISQEKLASAEELSPFIDHASQMAALDYIVSVESDIFIPTYSGNMARAVEGHRRFLGHRKTISPDRQEIYFYRSS